MSDKLFYKELSTPLQNTRLGSESTIKRKSNIKWIEDLDRANLSFRSREKLFLVHVTSEDERIYIQYPGKESTNTDSKPWDFRPRIYRANSEEPEPDLNFAQIWDVLFNNCEELIKSHMVDYLSIIATVLYRLAFMCDHRSMDDKEQKPSHILLFDNDGNIVKMDEAGLISLHDLYKYDPPNSVLDHISKVMPAWGGISFEAFLYLNDLLAWNEDCKYFYRNKMLHKGRWIGQTGRINTILSHISFLGLLSQHIKISEVMQRFARSRGVSPAKNDEIVKICDGYVS